MKKNLNKKNIIFLRNRLQEKKRLEEEITKLQLVLNEKTTFLQSILAVIQEYIKGITIYDEKTQDALLHDTYLEIIEKKEGIK